MDRANRRPNPGRERGAQPSACPAMTMMLTMMQCVMQQTAELLRALSQKSVAPPSTADSMIEAIKFGAQISGGKVPLDESEGGGVLDMLKGMVPYIPQIIAGLTGRSAAPAPRPAPAHPGVAPVPARPAIPGAVIPPQPAPVDPSAGVPPSAATPEDARALVMRRIVDEIRFSMNLPPSPKLFDHILDYIEAYMPEIVRQAEVLEGSTFAAYVVTLDPAFAGREDFFLALHKHLMESMEEPPIPANAPPPATFCRIYRLERTRIGYPQGGERLCRSSAGSFRAA